ncbi:uncharacterized protein CTRU02_215770 [Colletotrichum truncatum]|uniref:Uncharacterized protein n=1 Tax=Colletotrichum truncatum TaxID=5467 RepID=A0ACC3YB79_COLTU|nr:uncharacterized protein CTRU02_15106 [Colletotrichum truncatum]KAF6781466.1 hypothetical protein CTRU02_15106 [Colletotrichum truncatum]
MSLPLFSETERTCMSVELVESLGTASAEQLVTDLDVESVHDDELHCIGPFGVFRAFHESSSEQVLSWHQSLVLDQGEQQQSVTDGVHKQYRDEDSFIPTFPLLDEDIVQLPSEPMPLETNLDLGFPEPEDLSAEIEDWMQLGVSLGNGSPMSLSLDIPDMNFILSPRAGTPASQEPSLAHGAMSLKPYQQDKRLGVEVITEIPRNPTTGSSSLPPYTSYLLRHLKEEVLEGSATLLHRLSPWKALFLPRALQTFAEMSLWNTSSYTGRNILSSLLCKSAYHLHKSSNLGATSLSTEWLDVAATHQKEAVNLLKAALATESWTENQTDYAEMLMAMLSVGFTILRANDPRAVKKLLLDAERLIRLRGIPSDKPHTHRVLHHMYTHLRLIAESTSLKPLVQAAQADVASEPTASPEYNAAIGLPGFRLDENNLGKLDTTQEKTMEVGYNDIHLQVSGYWQPTLYPKMYSMPESLMTLLSQTISLATEKPALEAAALTSPSVSVALSHHTRTLEQQIWSWTPSPIELPVGPGRPQSLVTADTPALDNRDARSMVLAVHQAIMIFFYRRVYNMNAMIVQEQVRKTLDFLEPCVGTRVFDQDFAVTIGWSCFIAACEAVSPDLQKRGLEYLEAMDGSGVFIETDKPSVIAKAVWKRRACSGDMSYSWLDHMMQHVEAS